MEKQITEKSRRGRNNNDLKLFGTLNETNAIFYHHQMVMDDDFKEP